MKHIFLALIIMFSKALMAQDSGQSATIVASGSGPSKEEARNNAMRSAIEQAYGVYISTKMEVLNDQVVADEIVSVASGNITSYKILSEASAGEIHHSLLEVIVSISKLTSFAQSKGFEVEVKGGIFAANLKQQQLNENAEVKAARNSLSVALDLLNKGFDFNVEIKEPVLHDQINKIWNVETIVHSSVNSNYELAFEIVRSLLNDISLTKQEAEQYSTLGKPIYELRFYDMEFTDPITYYLRTSDGLWAFIRFAYKVPAMSHRFQLVDGIKYNMNGLTSSINDESSVTLHDEINKMIYQYFNSCRNYGMDFDGANSGGMNEQFASIVYCKRSNKEYLENYAGTISQKNYLYPNDPYYFHLPELLVTKFDLHKAFLSGYTTTISSSTFNLRYTEQELGNLASITCAALPVDVTPLGKNLIPYIDVTLYFDKDRLGLRYELDSKAQTRFTLNATYEEVETYGLKDFPYCYGYDSNSRTFTGFTYRFRSADYKTWNRTVVSNTLDEGAFDLRKTSLDLKKGLYSVPMIYLINIDGSLTLYSIGKIGFLSKGDLIQALQAQCGLGRLDLFQVNSKRESERKYLHDNEAEMNISSWIKDRISKIHNYPIPVVGKEGGLQLKTRYLGRDTFIFYID